MHLGEQAGISTFLLVQWLAPLASEAPELLVAGLFAWRLNTERRTRHAAVVEGEPVDAARRLAADRVRDLRRARSPACRSTRCSARSCSSPPRSRCSRSRCSRTAASACARRALLFGLFIVAVRARRACCPTGSASSSASSSGVVYLVLAAVDHRAAAAYLEPLVRDGLVVPGRRAVPRRTATRRRQDRDRELRRRRRPVDDGPPVQLARRVLARCVARPVRRWLVGERDRGDPRPQRRPTSTTAAGSTRCSSRSCSATRSAGWRPGAWRPTPSLTNGALAGVGRVRALDPGPDRSSGWCATSTSGLFSGHCPVLRPGQIFGHLVIAAGLGMLGGLLGVRASPIGRAGTRRNAS